MARSPGAQGLILTLLVSLLLSACALALPGSGRLPAGTVLPDISVQTPVSAESVVSPEFRAWLQENALPFATSEPESDARDLAALKSIIGNARIVALGEATHGTHEFFQMKHRILRYLVQEMGFTVFAMEANTGEAALMNTYVQTGQGDPAQLLPRLEGWPWTTQEVLDLIEWLRAYNANRGARPAVSFTGFDMQSAGIPIADALAYLHRVDEPAAKQADTLFECIRPYVSDTAAYALLSQATRTQCRRDLQTIYDTLGRHQLDDIGRSDPAGFAQALHNVRLVQQFEGVAGTGGGAARDRYMAENIVWLLNAAGPETKMVLWAHNYHVSVDPRTGETMGSYLRQQYGPLFLNAGFTFYSGSFNAYTMSGSGQMGSLTAQQAVLPTDSAYETYLHSAGLPRFMLDLRRVDSSPVATAWLAGPRPLRSVGAAYNPASPESGYSVLALPDAFDVLIYFEESSPSHLLFKQTVSVPRPVYPAKAQNLGFEEGTSNWAITGGRPQDYEVDTARSAAHAGGTGGYIRSETDQPGGYALLQQIIAAGDYRGKRLRLSAYAKTDNVAGSAGLIMRVDGANSILGISNMQNKPISGTTGWKRYDIVLDVPQEAVDIAFGAWLAGSGQFSFDDFRFETVGKNVPLTQ